MVPESGIYMLLAASFRDLVGPGIMVAGPSCSATDTESVKPLPAEVNSDLRSFSVLSFLRGGRGGGYGGSVERDMNRARGDRKQQDG
jgi:hypothetical protein